MYGAGRTGVIEVVDMQDFDLFRSCIGQFLYTELWHRTYAEVACWLLTTD
jgi:hypothetical protein